MRGMDEIFVDVQRNCEADSPKPGKVICMPAPRVPCYQSSSCLENLRLLAVYADCVKRTTAALRDREGFPAGSEAWQLSSEEIAEAVTLQTQAKVALLGHRCVAGCANEPPSKALAAGK